MARADGPITVCVINLKGGVGKSTIATCLRDEDTRIAAWMF